ncbi:hypothetical protein [Sphingomonas elodea]|uniref:hypothetical protein n=1 Tax=Sphingomonas elodea TaxID=179878 RepID=UPI0002630D3A|nr:hypothetical protein [Sphingomonas elodea]
MTVESKMAVGFWQMQTFEMAVRKGGFVPGQAIPSLAVGGEQTAGFGFHKCGGERRGLGASCRSAFSAEAAVDALPDSTSIIFEAV